MTLDFVVSYQADGRQYWDDNQRQGYQLAPTAGDVLYGPVVWVTNHTGSLDQFWGGQYHGSVVLKNLGYHKDVQVVYSTDHWQSQRVAYASYSPSYWASAYAHTTNPNPAGFEVWSYVLDVGAATAVEYAVRYQVNGQIYWDDNGGQNHQARLTNRQM
nr:carbohydrate-binding protein [Chitinivorax tropicus]